MPNNNHIWVEEIDESKDNTEEEDIEELGNVLKKALNIYSRTLNRELKKDADNNN